MDVGSVVAGVYRIDALLGAGGFGAVYRATRTDHGREVALKVLRSEGISAPEARARFEREARLAQRLAHPNTVRVLDFGTDASGVSYIAFELVRGRPLDAVAADGPMAPDRVAHVAAQVLKSLMEAHGLGIVHRDIKPANIIVCPVAGDPDHVKVVDFGIAKSSSPDSGATLTAAGTTVGTPAYMAPEQVLSRDVGPAADLYALGLVMAELLVGEAVFKGESGMAICMAQVSEAAVPLPAGVLESPLGQIVARATQKRPEERYSSAEKMLADLAAISSVRSAVVSVPSGPGGRGPIDAYAATLVGTSPFAATTSPAVAISALAPSPSPTLQPTAPPRAPRRTAWILATVALLACTLVAGILALRFLAGPRRPVRRPSPAPTETPQTDRPLARLTRDSARARLIALGWSVGTERPIDEGSLHITQFIATKPPAPDAVTVALHEHATPAGAQTAEQSLRDRFPRKLVAREGTRVLVVSSDRPTDAARDLFEALQR